MPTFNWVPDQGPTQSTKASVNRANFGDGYSQRVRDGINSLTETWKLNFTLRTKAEIVAIDDFLRAQAGATSFTWVTPMGRSLKFTCDTWEVSVNHDLDSSASMTFRQEHEA